MEIRSIDKGSTWPFVSPWYQHNHEEWDEDLNNDDVEHCYHNMLKMYSRLKI